MEKNREEIFLGKLTEEEETFWNEMIKNLQRSMPWREFEKFAFGPGSLISRNEVSLLSSGGPLYLAAEEICTKLQVRQGEATPEDKNKTIVIHYGAETLTIN